jgi:uncharacterized protein (TIGR02677 family)
MQTSRAEKTVARWQFDGQPLLRYATVPEAPMYREILQVFADAAAGYSSRLSPEDVHAVLLARLGPADGDLADDLPAIAEVKDRLEQLSRWGNLSQDFDTARATSLESYERTAYVYDLTPGGEAAAEAIATLEEAIRRVGGLQAVALRQIEEMLGQLVTELRVPSDGARIYALCEDLHTRFKSLTANAALFMQKVNRLLAAPVLTDDDYALFKADTITYLSDFITDLDTLAGQIRARLDVLDQIGAAQLRDALDAGEAASGQLSLGGAPDAMRWARLAETHLAGLATWFRGEPGARSGAGALYEKARAAVLGITRAAERIRESSSSPSSRSADLLALAARFEAGDDDDAHRLWHAAFGLSSSRHLGIVAADDTAPASASWWDSRSAVPVARQLRAGGRSDYMRNARRVTDRSAAKQALAAAARAAQQRAADAAVQLTRLGVVNISEINARAGGPVDPIVLRLLASLVYRALHSGRRHDGTWHAASIDGTMVIDVAEPLPPRAARLEAVTGTWTLPDFSICVEWRHSVIAAQRAAADISPSEAAGPLGRTLDLA